MLFDIMRNFIADITKKKKQQKKPQAQVIAFDDSEEIIEMMSVCLQIHTLLQYTQTHSFI